MPKGVKEVAATIGSALAGNAQENEKRGLSPNIQPTTLEDMKNSVHFLSFD
ncbi:MAG: hypothetical protein ACKVQT_07535 [Burkholderiales bacterium]